MLVFRNIIVGAAAALLTGAVMIAGATAEPADKRSGPRDAPEQAITVRAPDDVTVEMSLAAGFDPPSIEIKTGTRVIWHNIEPADYPVVSGHHQVVADDGSFASPKVAPGARWSHTFLQPGTFNYHCGLHPAMTGQIVVTGPPVQPEPDEKYVDIVEPDSDDQDTWGYRPSDITVEVGTTVIWTNNGAQDHTVTDDDGAFDSGNMNAGDEFSFTFRQPGIYKYFCEPHPWMKAVVRVHEPGKPPPQERSGEDDDESASYPPPSSSGGGAGPSSHGVNIVEPDSSDPDTWGFDPSTIEIGVGDTVIWTNTGETEHTATADDGSFDSGLLATGQTFEFTFERVGNFDYYCEPHPWMVASVTVSREPSEGGGARAQAPTPTTGAPSPAGTVPGVGPDTDIPAAQIADEFGPGLSGKEHALWVVILVLAVGLSFLVGQWWGQTIRARTAVRKLST